MEKCSECGKEMDAMEHNYGTPDILVCIHCYTIAQVMSEPAVRIKTSDEWNDLYTDANGNCYSDADEGL